jgi:hypothetical protein
MLIRPKTTEPFRDPWEPSLTTQSYRVHVLVFVIISADGGDGFMFINAVK